MATAPDTDDCLRMLCDLRRETGSWSAVAPLLGVGRLSLESWKVGRTTPSAAARKAIWATWARFLHPELMQTAWDWATWGRFYVPPSEPDPDNWSDWSI